MVLEDVSSRVADPTAHQSVAPHLRNAYLDHVISPLHSREDLEVFQPAVRRVAGLLEKGLLVSLREVEVMLVGNIQVSP